MISPVLECVFGTDKLSNWQNPFFGSLTHKERKGQWKYHCNKEEQIWLHIGSVSFTLSFEFYCHCYKLTTKGMLPISLNYTWWHTSENPASHVMSVKLKFFSVTTNCFAHRKHPDQAYLWMAAGRKKLTHPLRSLTRTRTLPPSLLV